MQPQCRVLRQKGAWLPHSTTGNSLFPLVFLQLRDASSSPDPEAVGNEDRIAYNWLATAGYSAEGPLTQPLFW